MEDTLEPGTRFDDGEFDWESFGPRGTAPVQPQPTPGMNRLAWSGLVLLTFCPPLGFALATLWR